MININNSIEASADDERAWVAALSGEQVKNPMNTIPWEDKVAVHIYSEQAQAKFRVRI